MRGDGESREDSSGGEELATQARAPEFGAQHPCKTRAWQSTNETQEPETVLEFAGQPA